LVLTNQYTRHTLRNSDININQLVTGTVTNTLPVYL